MTDQSQITRRQRYAKGCCPTHGTALTQTGHDGRGNAIVVCPRKGCRFLCKVDINGKHHSPTERV